MVGATHFLAWNIYYRKSKRIDTERCETGRFLRKNQKAFQTDSYCLTVEAREPAMTSVDTSGARDVLRHS